MRAVVVYESMYGNTDQIAHAVGKGLETRFDVTVVPVEEATKELIDHADLVVVGGPTHAHSMSRESTRKAAVEAAQKPDSELTLDPDAEGPGLRDWFEDMGKRTANAAAFDTRLHLAAALTGRASKGISKRLRHHGYREIVPPESFFVTKETHLEPDEETRAVAWGETLAKKAA